MSAVRRMAFCLAAAICLFSVTMPVKSEEMKDGEMSYASYIIEAAAYPETPVLPAEDADWSDPAVLAAVDAWYEATEARRNAAITNPEGYYSFVEHSAQALLNEDGANRVYSPLSLWLDLDMLAQLSAGESRAQLLDMLGEASLETLAAQHASLWKSQYWDDGNQACALGAALWLDQSVMIQPEAAAALASRCAASVFQGDMKSPGYNEALREWLNLSTRGLLSDEVSALRFEDEAQMSAAATIYYRGRWVDAFSKSATAPGVFHGAVSDAEADFMHEAKEGTLYHGEHFTAFAKDLGDMGSALFVLPDAETSPQALIMDDEVFRLMRGMATWEHSEDAIVRFAMPKLDCREQLDLKATLEQLGLGGLFSAETADFSEALSGERPVHLSSMLQISRVVMDEEGVEAAAITVTDVFGALVQELDEVDFVLDRPFLFVLMGQGNVPLFMGVVSQL